MQIYQFCMDEYLQLIAANTYGRMNFHPNNLMRQLYALSSLLFNFALRICN
jgi:hypothetical protein